MRGRKKYDIIIGRLRWLVRNTVSRYAKKRKVAAKGKAFKQVISAEYVRFETGRLWKSRQDLIGQAGNAVRVKRNAGFSDVL